MATLIDFKPDEYLAASFLSIIHGREKLFVLRVSQFAYFLGGGGWGALNMSIEVIVPAGFLHAQRSSLCCCHGRSQ